MVRVPNPKGLVSLRYEAGMFPVLESWSKCAVNVLRISSQPTIDFNISLQGVVGNIVSENILKTSREDSDKEDPCSRTTCRIAVIDCGDGKASCFCATVVDNALYGIDWKWMMCCELR